MNHWFSLTINSRLEHFFNQFFWPLIRLTCVFRWEYVNTVGTFYFLDFSGIIWWGGGERWGTCRNTCELHHGFVSCLAFRLGYVYTEKRPLLLKFWIKHVLWLIKTVYFIIVRIQGEKAQQCVWFQLENLFGFIENSNLESYVSGKTHKQRATCLH